MTLEHPCHLFSCVMFEQFVIFLTTTLLFIFANVRVLKEFALNYMYAKHTALMSLGKIKPFHTQSQVTQPLVYVTTESSSYANIHYITIFNDGRSRQIVLLIILFFCILTCQITFRYILMYCKSSSCNKSEAICVKQLVMYLNT